MRVYGRVPVDPANPGGDRRWVVVETDVNGFNDAVHLTALAQTLKLNLMESPFWGNFGIPARQSVMSQVMPDYYAALTQQYYSQFFASLTIAKQAIDVAQPTPTYDIFAITHSGAVIPPFRVNGAPT